MPQSLRLRFLGRDRVRHLVKPCFCGIISRHKSLAVFLILLLILCNAGVLSNALFCQFVFSFVPLCANIIVSDSHVSRFLFCFLLHLDCKFKIKRAIRVSGWLFSFRFDQTSSMMTIGAASPRRTPSFKIRV